MNKINAIDRVPSEVLSNGAIRYGVYNSSGVLQEYVYIKKEDDASVSGTPINKVLFDKIDNNLEEIQDNVELTNKYVDAVATMVEEIRTDNVIPTTNWEEITAGTEYSNGSMKITADSCSNATSYPIIYAVDNDTTTRWRSATGTGSHNVVIDFGSAIKINKFGLGQITTYNSITATRYFAIQGSNDNSAWTELLKITSNPTSSGNIVEQTLTTTGEYRYYRFLFYYSQSSNYLMMYEIQTSEYVKKIYKLSLSLGLTAYEQGLMVLLKTPSDLVEDVSYTLNIDDLGDKVVGTMKPDTYYVLVYNGTSFDIVREMEV